MAVTWKAIEGTVIAAVQAVCERYGFTCPTLSGDICPLRDIGGLDSLHCVEIVVDIAALIPIDTDNSVFWTDSGSLRTIQQVAKHLASKQRSP